MDDKFEFMGVEFTSDEAKLILESAGYSKFDIEYGRGPSGFSEFRWCCNHPNGKRMFAEYAWKQERDNMIKRIMLSGLSPKSSEVLNGGDGNSRQDG